MLALVLLLAGIDEVSNPRLRSLARRRSVFRYLLAPFAGARTLARADEPA